MSPLEIKKMKLELLKVSTAKADLEYRIEERLEEVERIRANVVVQEEKENELKHKIAEAEKASI